MGWEIGEFDGRDIGYGVPAICDKPGCKAEIDRGLSYVCGSDPYGGEFGCGMFFCGEHLLYREPKGSGRYIQLCPRCFAHKPPYKRPSPDVPEWINHKMTHESWVQWRKDEGLE